MSYVIVDNLSTHKTHAVRTCLLDRPDVHGHFTPTRSSLLNPGELSFSKVDDLLPQGILPSLVDLARKIRG